MRACSKRPPGGLFGKMSAASPRLWALLLIPVAALLMAAELPAAGRISQYRLVFQPFFDDQGTLLAAVRQFRRADEERFFVLDPVRFEWHETAAAKVLSSRTATAEDWRKTPFARALDRHTSPPYPLQNDGLREADQPMPGFFLTADLCPSKKPLDRRSIEATAALPLKTPVPIALMVSGLWIQRHEVDLAWLKEQDAKGRLRITWVNHSYAHRYDPAAPLERNFLLMAGTDFTAEVLSLESLLVENDLIPSPFFRFPGLVSDRRLIERLRELNLIPVGSSAWLAKGETPQPGGIILIHANGNEPDGVRLLLTFYESHREAFSRGDLSLLPLREALTLP
jgi:hypothetical protein